MLKKASIASGKQNEHGDSTWSRIISQIYIDFFWLMLRALKALKVLVHLPEALFFRYTHRP